MNAIWFRHGGVKSLNAYSPRGDYQGRIAPSGNPEGGYHVLAPMTIAGLRNEYVAAWAPTADDAKHAFLAAIG